MTVTEFKQHSMINKFNDISAELESWYASDNGQYLLESLGTELSRVLDVSFGYHLLQTGPVTGETLLAPSKIHHHIVSRCVPMGGVGLVATDEELPLESDSIDVVVALHSLEFCSNPHQALRELQRVLMPQGHLIVIGFNPYSLKGLRNRVLARGRDSPWRNQHPLSQHRLSDWLHLLGCEVERSASFYSLPPVGKGRFRSAVTRCDQWLNNHGSPFGGIYITHAIKQVSGVNVRAKRVRRRERLMGLAVSKPATAPAPTPAQPSSRDGDVAA